MLAKCFQRKTLATPTVTIRATPTKTYSDSRKYFLMPIAHKNSQT